MNNNKNFEQKDSRRFRNVKTAGLNIFWFNAFS